MFAKQPALRSLLSNSIGVFFVDNTEGGVPCPHRRKVRGGRIEVESSRRSRNAGEERRIADLQSGERPTRGPAGTSRWPVLGTKGRGRVVDSEGPDRARRA